MPEFNFPLQADDLLEHNGDRYMVQLPFDVANMAPEEITDMLEDVGSRLQADPSCMPEHDVFDKLFAVASKFVSMDARVKTSIVALLHSELKTLLQLITQRYGSHTSASADDDDGNEASNDDGNDDAHTKSCTRNALKMFCYLISLVIDLQEKHVKGDQDLEPAVASVAVKKSRGTTATKKGVAKRKGKSADEEEVDEFVWEAAKEQLTNSMVHVLEHTCIAQLWKMAAPEEEFGTLFFRTASALLECEANLKCTAIKLSVFKMLVYPTKRFQLYIRATTSMLHVLMNFEHAAIPLAELMQMFCIDHDCPKIVGDVCREIGRLPSAELEKDRGGAKSISAFLLELSARLPRLVFQHLVLLSVHLDGESYNMRNGIVAMIGQLISSSTASANGVSDAPADSVSATLTLTNKQRDGLLSVLAERIHDVTAFTRAAALKTWTLLAETGAVPVRHFHSVVSLAIDRLEDKSSIVRKVAVQLLSALLQNNPFLGDLSADNFKVELAKLEKDFQELHQQELQKELQESERILSENQTDAFGEDATEQLDITDADSEVAEMEVAVEKSASAATTVSEESKLLSADAQEIEAQKRKYIYLHAAVRFIDQMELALPAIVRLLGSGVVSDIEEAIEFLVQAASFKLPGAHAGVEQMLHLVWSKESSIKATVVNAYRRLYLVSASGTINSKQTAQMRLQQSLFVALQLVGLTVNSTLATMTSLEELITVWMCPSKLQSSENCGQSNSDASATELAAYLDDNVIEALWSIFVSPAGTYVPAQRRGALLLLGFASNAKPTIIGRNVVHVINHGLPQPHAPIEQADLPLARAACLALQKLFTRDNNRSATTAAGTMLRGVSIDELVSSLTRLVLSDSTHAAWFAAAEQAVATIFLLHERPDAVATTLLQQATNQWLLDGASNSSTAASSGLVVPIKLSKFFFLLGQVALKMLVYIERIESRVKFLRSNRSKTQSAVPVAVNVMNSDDLNADDAAASGNDDDDEDDDDDDDEFGSKKKSRAKKSKSSKKGAAGKVAARKAITTTVTPNETPDLQAEMGMAGTDEYELEMQREHAERSLLGSTASLMGRMLPLTVLVLKSPAKFPDATLQRSAVLALSKCMTVHAEICETYLPVLFTLLEKSGDASLRANIMIALGDMAFRFPNLIDPWTSKMYAPLRDKQQPRVRKTTLMVLTHLILNDMIKVKGEISEMAVCIDDADSRIADLAKLFFHELAKKGKNPVYNILPDTLSRLSSSNEISPALFQSVLRFLLQFIDKDKQTESLIEKLCQRLLAAPDVKGIRDFAYCLSQLSFASERCVRKLIDAECFKCYKDRLSDVEVFSYYASIARQMKKTVIKSAQELRDQVDEWEKRIEILHTEQADDANTADRAASLHGSHETVQAPIADVDEAPIKILVPIVAPRKVVRGGRSNTTIGNASAATAAVAALSVVKKPAPKKKSKARKQDSSDDEENDENSEPSDTDEPIVQKTKPTAGARRGRRATVGDD